MARAPPLQGGCRGFESLWAHVNKPTVNELAEIIELRYPKSLAVEWDVVGFATNNSNIEVNNILITIDVTEDVVAEAIEKSIDLIISHHPLILDPEEISDIINLCITKRCINSSKNSLIESVFMKMRFKKNES